MHTFFYKAYQFIDKNRTFFFVVLAAVFLGLLAIVLQVKFEEDISKLIPSNAENKQLQKVLKNVEFTDKIIVNIQKKAGTTEDLTVYASQFTDSIKQFENQYIKNIQGVVEDEMVFETLDFVYKNLPLFLTEADYPILKKRLSENSIAKTMEDNYKTLISPSGIISKQQILKDPLHITDLAFKNLKTLGVEEGFKMKNGFVMTENEKNILLFITPTFPSSNSEKNTVFTDKLNTLQRKLNKKFDTKVSSEFYGAAFIAAANTKQIKTDIQFTIGIALTLLLFAFIFFYKSVWTPLLTILPTVFGALLALAVLVLIRTEISAISLGIGSILIGVTLDYSLHILTHIRNGETKINLFKSVSKPILMSSLTTALAFLCLLFIESQALQDLGIFAAVSVMGASVMALVLIPQVYKKEVTKKALQKSSFLDRVAAYPLHKNKVIVVGLGILLIVSCFSYNAVEFNHDLEQLNYKPQSLIKTETELEKISNSVSKSVYVATYNDTLENALQQNDSVYTLLNKLKETSKIEGFKSVGSLVFSEQKQSEKIEKWNQFWTKNQVKNTEETIETNADKLGFKTNTFSSFSNLLTTNFKPLKHSEYSKMGGNLTADFISEKNNFNTITSTIQLKENNSKTLQKIFKQIPNTLLIDRKQVNETLLGNLKTDFNRLIWYCFGVVLLLLFLFYRNWKLVLVTVIPICLTWLLTIGIMGMFQLQFNVFNSIISAFIFGLGVDYSIFITNALLNNERKHTLATHKTAILLSLITTILGVGVLVFAKHPALHSVALVSVIGIFSAVLIAFTIQPLLFNLLIFKKEIVHHGNH